MLCRARCCGVSEAEESLGWLLGKSWDWAASQVNLASEGRGFGTSKASEVLPVLAEKPCK